MPGVSWEGPLPSLTPVQEELSRRLRDHVRALAEPRNVAFPEGLERARQYLVSRLEGARQLGFEAMGRTFHNLEAGCLEGPCVVVGAHYDSVLECPGANDNASGVAAVLELSRLLRGVAGLRFVLFANEEPPFYGTEDMGSVRYVEARGGDVRAMLCLETVGYYTDVPDSQRSPFPDMPTVGNFVAFVGDARSASLARLVVGVWRDQVAFPSLAVAPTPALEPLFMQAGMGLSDHASFWEAGIPALMVTDTVFYRYDHYHELSDTWDKLTYEPFARMVDGLARVLAEVAPRLTG